MKYIFKNLGPIKQTSLETNKLTVICGPNNSGKTYITYTLCSFHEDIKKILRISSTLNIGTRLIADSECLISIEELKPILIQKLRESSVTFSSELNTVFSASKSYFNNSSIQVEIDEKHTDFIFSSETELVQTSRDFNLTYTIHDEGKKLQISLTQTNPNSEKSTYIRPTLNSYVDFAILFLVSPKILNRPFFIPAERTGVALFYKDLDAKKHALVDAIQRMTKKEANNLDPYRLINETTSRYAKPIHLFIDAIRDYQKKSESLSVLYHMNQDIKELLNEFIGGRFIHREDGIYFVNSKKKDNRIDIPFHITSQFLKSTFAIYMYIKHMARKDDVLIIDEPELYLHPDNQKKLTRLLCTIVNKGINVILTTHSEHVIQEIQAMVMLGDTKNLEKKNLITKKYGIKSLSILHPSEVNFYNLKSNHLNKVDFNFSTGYRIDSIAETMDTQSNLYLDLLED